ncbi:MAG: bifunctional 2-C-methyl-D-erythritol 4-phosphate cytidylyltransferase/2-C-methyl-D-erythritol 2,4-cyclodiphosphate synthase [Micropepsaceae bacterium]
MSEQPCATLIVAAGRGERAPRGAKPKQYRLLAEKPVLRWVLDAFVRQNAVDPIQVVIREEDRPHFDEAARGLNLLEPIVGGETRQESVSNGLEALKAQSPANVLIHDGARPFVSQELIQRVVGALSNADAVAPLLAVSDTIWRRNRTGYERVPREELRRAQTPQGFSFEAILAAHREYRDAEVTDDMALAELAGMTIKEVPGEEVNLKLTKSEDFELAEKIASSTAREVWGDVRTGTGFDVHKFSPGEHVWLCGVRIAHNKGLAGHSDADVGLHALTDAVLGSICAGDIGVHFPPSDPQWRNAPSHIFMEKAASLVRERGGIIAHVDVTLICQEPKVAPHRERMRKRMAEILNIDLACVSVKATTTEGLGAVGRGEGIAAQAIATVRLPVST